MSLNQAREQMIEQQVRAWEVLDERVLGVLAQVRRELFVPQALRSLAFADTQIPIGHAPRWSQWFRGARSQSAHPDSSSSCGP